MQSDAIVIYYVLYSSLFYAHLASAFAPQKDSYYIHDDTDPFFLFLL